MSDFRFDKALRMARGVAQDTGQESRLRISDYSEKIESKRRELAQIQKDLSNTKDGTVLAEYRRRRKRTQQEIFNLKRKLRAAQNGVTAELATGALPDFVIIGARKAGTTFLYNLLTRHPYVEPAAVKEVHYFDNLMEKEDIEWYTNCFPAPELREGRRTITGEATPYLAHPLAPERMARVIPQARLIALLRNPVDRAYSDYQHVVRRGREPLTFDEAVGLEEAVMGGGNPLPSGKHEGVGRGFYRGYLSRGIYVDQLLRWRRVFGEERMLVLKSEEFFGHTSEILRLVLDFLELPEWEPGFWEETPEKRNQGSYGRSMDPATRRRLEHFFKPHNHRLYEYLGVDFGW